MRVVDTDADSGLRNVLNSGFWNPQHPTFGRYRLINQTMECQGQQYIISASPRVSGGHLSLMPAHLVDEQGKVWLLVCRGTLVPVDRRGRPPKRALRFDPKRV